MKARPEIVEQKHLEYLDDLRESGVTNMFGAATYIRERFSVTRTEASEILSYWMQSFNERHKVNESEK